MLVQVRSRGGGGEIEIEKVCVGRRIQSQRYHTRAVTTTNIIPRARKMIPTIMNSPNTYFAVNTGRQAGICCCSHLFPIKSTQIYVSACIYIMFIFGINCI